jgi:hypothetical protein
MAKLGTAPTSTRQRSRRERGFLGAVGLVDLGHVPFCFLHVLLLVHASQGHQALLRALL